MGEYADWQLEQYLDGLSMDSDGLEEDGSKFPETTKKCRCCGVEDLHWETVNDKWRLFSRGGKIHVCAVKPLPKEMTILRVREKIEFLPLPAGYRMSEERRKL